MTMSAIALVLSAMLVSAVWPSGSTKAPMTYGPGAVPSGMLTGTVCVGEVMPPASAGMLISASCMSAVVIVLSVDRYRRSFVAAAAREAAWRAETITLTVAPASAVAGAVSVWTTRLGKP